MKPEDLPPEPTNQHSFLMRRSKTPEEVRKKRVRIHLNISIPNTYLLLFKIQLLPSHYRRFFINVIKYAFYTFRKRSVRAKIDVSIATRIVVEVIAIAVETSELTDAADVTEVEIVDATREVRVAVRGNRAVDARR